MITCSSLSVRYGGIQAVTGADIHVADGEFVALTGANGAGKSSLIKAIMGIVEPADGTVRFGGTDITRQSTQKRVRLGLGLVPEGRSLFAGMTVVENLTLGAYQHLGSRPHPSRGDLDHVFEMFPRLHNRQSQPAGTLSGGEQQMLALSRALMARPKLLICDEPSTGLAPLLVTEILQTLRGLCDNGMTILLAEQNASAALEIADRGYVLENGDVVMEGESRDLLNDPEIINAYLGEAPREAEPTNEAEPINPGENR